MMKRQDGQYFTRTNPFAHEVFCKWVQQIPPIYRNDVWCEPFAGANNIVEMLNEIDIKLSSSNQWKCYDILPDNDLNTSGVAIEQRDMIVNYPHIVPQVAITNPPYLAKNSATRRGLFYPDTQYDDVYKLCIDIMLKKHKYIAAIIPESFIRTNLFGERLFAVISLNCEMFDDTDCPVCLAMWNDQLTSDYKIYLNNGFCVGSISNLNKFKPQSNSKYNFNDPYGKLGLNACDSVINRSIKFIKGDYIKSDKIKLSSRCNTRISGFSDNIDIDDLIITCNFLLNEWRDNTTDVFMTSFKGLRSDGYYRRRLDWVGASYIIDMAILKLNILDKAG